MEQENTFPKLKGVEDAMCRLGSDELKILDNNHGVKFFQSAQNLIL